MRKLIYTLVVVCCFGTLQAQDIHYTQFYNAPFFINPALTGIYRGDLRLMANYRSQWASVPVDYKTFTAGGDLRVHSTENGFFSMGLALNHDKAGYSNLQNNNVNLTGSYTRRLGKFFYGTVGAQMTGAQRVFKMDDLSFDNQFDGTQADFSRPTGEDFPDQNNSFFDLAAGFNLRFQTLSDASMIDKLEQRTKFDVGVGIFHLNRPNQSFIDDAEVPLPIRISPYLFGTVKLTDNIDVIGRFLCQFQTSYDEYLYGVAGKLHLNRTPGKQLALMLGINHRFHDFGESYSPTIEVHYNAWRAGFSYDVNTSEFNVATERRSGPEFSLRYIIFRVKSLPEFKICPLI